VAFASGTKANLWCQWKALFLFCLFFDLPYLPVSSESLQLFAQFLSRSFKSVDTVKNYVSGAKLLHVLLDMPCSAFDNFSLKLTFKGLTRIKCHISKQALPITKEMLLRMFDVLDMKIVEHVVYWSLFLIAFFTMSRKSNLVVSSYHEKFKCLRRQDVLVGADSLLVMFMWSKTNQFGSRVHKIPLTRMVGSVLCPVSAYKYMCHLLPIDQERPAFCLIKNNVVLPVTYVDLQSFLKGLVSKLGYDSARFSSHSFRRGSASHAFRAGVSSNMIQAIGDWSSDAYKVYLNINLEDKIAAVTKMYQG
jgi:hypothetical protein